VDDKSSVFSTGQTQNDYFDRFRCVFDEIVVLGYRQNMTDKTKSKAMSEIQLQTLGLTYVFCNLPDSVNATVFLSKDFKRIIEKYILWADAVIGKAPSDASYYGSNLARKYRKPCMLEIGGCPWDALWNYSWKGKLLALPSMLKLKHAVSNAQYANYVTDEFLQRRYPCKGKSLGRYTDVYLKPYDPLTLAKRLSKIESSDNHFLIGTTAALDVPYKGQKYVIQALKILKEKGIKNIEYQLVGRGDQSCLKEVAEKYGVSNMVKFLGSLRHEEVFDWLDNIDIYIQPSYQEGLPRAVIEAMSRGLPCIGSNAGGIPELIDSDYVYNRKRSAVKKIAELIIKLTKQATMKEQAEKNFEKSKSFESNVLEKRRNEFYKLFISKINL